MTKMEILLRRTLLTKHIVDIEDEDCVPDEVSWLSEDDLRKCQTEILTSCWQVEEWSKVEDKSDAESRRAG